MLSLVTINAIPQHRCRIGDVDTGVYSDWNSTALSSSFQLKEDLPDSCHMLVDGNLTKCSSYVYDDTYYKDTRSMDWTMVCDDRIYGAIAQTIYMLGVFTGAVTLGRQKMASKGFELILISDSQVDLLIKSDAKRFSAGLQHFNSFSVLVSLSCQNISRSCLCDICMEFSDQLEATSLALC
jgi:hypothetical protein